MFKVTVSQLEHTYEELKLQIRMLNQNIEEMEDIARGLMKLSGMEEIEHVQKVLIQQLEVEKEQYRQLMLAASRAAASYRECENRNVNRCMEYGNRSDMAVGYVDMERLISQLNDNEIVFKGKEGI